MTTSIVFDNIDYSQIEYDVDSYQENMLTDPSSSIIALQRLRYLKTRPTGNQVITPNITGRAVSNMLDYNEINYEQYKMRRKSEVLKYNKNSGTNKNKKYSSLVSLPRRKKSNSQKIIKNCEDEVIRYKKGINSGIKNDKTILYHSKQIPFYDKL